MLRRTPFTFELKVKKNPKGIKVIYELTQEQMEEMTKEALAKQRSKTEE